MPLFYALIGLIVYFIVGRVVTDIYVKNGVVGDDGFEKLMSNIFYPIIALGILVMKTGDLIYRIITWTPRKKDANSTNQNEKK
jgi:ATP/ADP translocase